MTSINSLNGALLLRVFSYLPIEDLYAVEQTCTWWWFLLDRCWFDEDKFYAHKAGMFCNNRQIEFITRRRFKHTDMYKYSKPTLKTFHFEDVEIFLPQIKYLNLKGIECLMKHAIFISSNCRSLSLLTLRVGIFVQCHHIEQLSLNNKFLTEMCIVGHYCREVNDCLRVIPPHLKVLSWQRCHMCLTNLNVIFPNWNNLSYFRIDVCDNIVNELINDVLVYLKNLEAFSCSFVTKDTKQLEPYKMPFPRLAFNRNLSYLVLINNCLFNDSMLESILDCCNALRYLYIGFLPFEKEFGNKIEMTPNHMVELTKRTVSFIPLKDNLKTLCLYGVKVEDKSVLEPILYCCNLFTLCFVTDDEACIDFCCDALTILVQLRHLIALGRPFPKRGLVNIHTVLHTDDELDIEKNPYIIFPRAPFKLEIERGSFTEEVLQTDLRLLQIIESSVSEYVNKWKNDFFSSLLD